MSYGPAGGRWRIKNPEELNEWLFGEFIDENTRGELVPGTDVEAIWTFDPSRRSFKVVTPRADRT